jgi:uncharacterized protein CbrC (UPF0167 family)
MATVAAGRQTLEPFRYFQNPIHPLSSWTTEEAACHFCDASGPGFDGPFYGPHDIARVCEACLRNGRLADLELTTCEGDASALAHQLASLRPDLSSTDLAEVARARTAELEQRTPGLITWQDFFWPAHCGDYCTFVEELGTPELVALAEGQDPQTWFCSRASGADLQVWDAIRKDSARANPTTSYDLTVYRFSCRACPTVVLHWDAS